MASYENLTYKQLRQQVYRELGCGGSRGNVIPNAKITSIAAGSITSTDFFQDSGLGTGQYRGLGIFRPDSATAADNWRMAGDLGSSGLLNQTGASYSDTTVGSEVIELWEYGVRPDIDIIDGFNQMLKEEYLTTTIALSHLSNVDGDMSDTGVTNWTTIGTLTTKAKDTTAARTPYGMRNLHTLNNSSANAGIRSPSIPLAQARYYSMFTISSTAVGTSSLQPYNSTTASTTGMPTAITTSEAEPQLMVFRNQNAPSTAHGVAMNMTNTSAVGDTYWNQAWMYNLDNLIIRLPSYVSEHFKAPQIYQLVPRFSTSTTGQSIWNAQGIDPVPLNEGTDYRFQFNHGDANPYQVVFSDRHFYQWPLVIEARRPYYDIVASGAGFSAETDTFPGASKTYINRVKVELLKRIYIPRFGDKDKRWATLLADAQLELDAANYDRPVEAFSRAMPYYHGPAGRM